jgi:hypothetical protein
VVGLKNAIIFTNLLENTFELANYQIVKYNKLRSRIILQQIGRKKILDGSDRVIRGFENLQLCSGLIYNSELQLRMCLNR